MIENHKRIINSKWVTDNGYAFTYEKIGNEGAARLFFKCDAEALYFDYELCKEKYQDDIRKIQKNITSCYNIFGPAIFNAYVSKPNHLCDVPHLIVFNTWFAIKPYTSKKTANYGRMTGCQFRPHAIGYGHPMLLGVVPIPDHASDKKIIKLAANLITGWFVSIRNAASEVSKMCLDSKFEIEPIGSVE